MATCKKKFGQGLEDFKPIFGKFESKKSQILVAHQKKDMDGTKKVWLPAKKKFGQGLEDFAPIFGKLNTPYGMFESKKSQILVAHQKEDMDGAKKVWLPAKKSSARVQRISHLFWGS